MASIGKDRNGRKRILFVAEDGSRKTVRLGKASIKQAEAFKVKLEALIAGRLTGNIDQETARWIGELPDDMHAKLAKAGLSAPRPETQGQAGSDERLGAFLDAYLKDRDDLKPNSQLVYGHTRRTLVEFFGAEKPLREITEYDAERWQRYLGRQGLSKATVRKRTANAKVFFRVAVKQKMIPANPFQELKSTSVGNDERQYFVSRQEAEKVLDACPDAQWRLIFALCRYGGLRCPSEVLALTWPDVNWEQSRILIHSPKTEHHEGKESRVIPMFPELAPHLREVFEQAEPGTEHVITRYRQANVNLRTQLQRILKRAGLKPWPRLFQNLRSSRETELVEDYPLHVVTAWIGNSKAIAAKHYLQLRDADFDRAAGTLRDEDGAAQNPAQYPAVWGGNEQQETQVGQDENADFPLVTADYRSVRENPTIPSGDEGNRTLILAMRPPCAPVTPRPQEPFQPVFYGQSAKSQALFNGFRPKCSRKLRIPISLN